MNKAEELKKVILDGTLAERKYIFEQSPKLFAYYYFTNYFHYDPAPFHEEMWEDYRKLMDDELTEAAWIMFRESAKTSIAKICLIHSICYEKKKYINWDSYDKGNAEQALFDVTLQLQTNHRLIADFGELYNEPKDHKAKTRKKVGDFITTNGIRVEAHSTQESVRGRIYGDQRPDWIIADDFETETTKDSAAVTKKIIDHYDAAIAGMAPSGCILYLGNYITDAGSVAHILKKVENNPKGVARDIPVERDGEILWPDKYVHTDEEAANYKGKHKKVSLETKQRQIDNYDAEMLNSPYSAEDLFFNRIKIDKAYESSRKPEEISAGLSIFEQFKPSNRYGIGADVAEGTGKDHSASVIIDFESGEVVGTFMDNRIPPDRFADELKRQSDLYGGCIVGPERNSVGVATVIRLIDNGADIFIDHKHAQIGDPVTKKYGWRTTKESKANMLYQFKKAFEDGNLKILDRRLLDEMKTYTRADFLETSSLVTNHYDLLIAACIAWQMRDHAPIPAHEDTDFDNDYIPNQAI